MAKRKVATKAEKDVIDRLAHAFACEEIAKHVIRTHYPDLEESYKAHMRKTCPEFYRLLDELQKAIPRVRKQMLKEFEKEVKVQTHER
ncbi:MAG: hypothetical protein HRU18_09540 [Pseudoalteromonas sp.]|jgi:hypothetical protein|nr:hypothetical protein [Pseudoalteromonas sp.]NRA78438.1 hypothetical protein [Pseudoalteromonas sp.]